MSATLYTQRLEAPAVSAVALADVLSYLRLPANTPEVSLVTQFMESAVQAVELSCGLGLIRQKWRLWPINGKSVYRIVKAFGGRMSWCVTPGVRLRK